MPKYGYDELMLYFSPGIGKISAAEKYMTMIFLIRAKYLPFLLICGIAQGFRV